MLTYYHYYGTLYDCWRSHCAAVNTQVQDRFTNTNNNMRTVQKITETHTMMPRQNFCFRRCRWRRCRSYTPLTRNEGGSTVVFNGPSMWTSMYGLDSPHCKRHFIDSSCWAPAVRTFTQNLHVSCHVTVTSLRWMRFSVLISARVLQWYQTWGFPPDLGILLTWWVFLLKIWVF